MQTGYWKITLMSGPRPGCPELAAGSFAGAPVAFAQDRIGEVYDSVHIAPGLDERSDAPLNHWREQMQRLRQKKQEQNPRRKPHEIEPPAKPVGSIDDYA
jgi:hypothetical protein